MSDAPANPAIPLTDETRLAYQLLYNTLQSAIETTNDPLTLETLIDARMDVNDILTKDAMYRIHQNSAAYDDLLQSIQDTNADLLVLKDRITAVSAHIALAAEILKDVNKVLSLVPGL